MSSPVRSDHRKPMRLRFRLWEKKRGDRRTGSQRLGRASEMLFFAGLFLGGMLALSELIVAHLVGDAKAGGRAGWADWLLLLVFATLAISGAVGLLLTVLQAGTSAERRSMLAKRASILESLAERSQRAQQHPTIPSDANLTNSPGVRLRYRLPISQSPGWKLLVVAVFNLVWNGLVAVLAVLVLNQYNLGVWDAWSLLPVGLFGLFGLASLYYLFRLLLVATAIGPTSVEVSDHPLYPGRSYRVYVAQMGQLSVQALRLSLVCDERVSYHQGTDTRIETRRVFQQEVFQEREFSIRPGAPFEAECDLRIPERVMHSFQADHNMIDWKLVVRGETQRWPQYERSFPVVIYPPLVAEQQVAEMTWNR